MEPIDIKEHNTTPFTREMVYNEHLKEINEIKFTSREIDIISCIIHSRKEKKIAEFLSVAPKTVNSHVYNIMNKLRYNNRELVIDFVEKSGKLQYLRQYYCCILVENLFEKTLEKIGKLINKGVSCNFFCSRISKDNRLLLKLIDYLSIANVKLINANSNKNDKENNADFYLHVVTSESEIPPLSLIDGNYKDNIILLFNTINFNISNLEHVDFRNEQNFYDATLNLLSKLIKGPEIMQEIQQFNQEYSGLQESWRGGSNNGKNETKDSVINLLLKKKYLVIFVAILVISSFGWSFIMNNRKQQEIARINKEFAEFVSNFSFENIGVTEGVKKNVNFLQKIDDVIANMNHEQMLEHIVSGKSTNKEVLNYLYGIHAIAQNSLYNEYNSTKSRNLLLIAKKVVESYINSKSKIKIDFVELTPQELYTEVSIRDEIPEIYTKILYLLGRTYTYFEEIKLGNPIEDMPVEEFEKYYETGSYIGQKVRIFEGFLSERSFIEMVKLYKIKQDIKKGNTQKAIDSTRGLIKMLSDLRKDNTEYMLDYRPEAKNLKIVIPNQDKYNKSYLLERILQHYSRLLSIDDNQENKIAYANEIASYFTGNQNEVGTFDELDGVPDKKIACLLNNLGFVLIQLFEQNVDFSKIQNVMREKLKLKAEDKLEQIKQLFELAKIKSINNHYPKMHSYRGLIEVYKNMLKRNDLTKAESAKLAKQIQDLQKKADTLQEKLKSNS